MSIVKLTKDLKNFKWTKYDSIGNNSQIEGRHGGFKGGGQPPHSEEHSLLDDGAGINLSRISGRQIELTQDLSSFNWTDYSRIGNDQSPQSFDANGTVVTGNKIFNRPSQKALDTMESRFGITDKTQNRGPYRIVDFMDGTKQGRGFMVGGSPVGFTKNIVTVVSGGDIDAVSNQNCLSSLLIR